MYGLGLVLLLAHDGDHGGHMWGGDGWMWLWGGLMMLLWIGVAVVVIWAIVRAFGNRRHGEADAAGILAERYARGELTTEEYEERAATLGLKKP